MNEEIVKRIEADPNYQELVFKRNKFSISLAVFILVMYYGYILTIAFEPSLLGVKIGDGIMSIGYPIGAGIIILCFITTLIYVKRANGEFEDLNDKIKDDVKDMIDESR